MAYSPRSERIEPRTATPAHPTAAPSQLSVFTGALPGRLGGAPLAADPRQPWPKRLRTAPHRGRPIPYAPDNSAAALPAPRSVLSLMTSVIGPPLRRLQVAPLGLPVPLPASGLAASPRTVGVSMVATTADGEWTITPPAKTGMKDRNLECRHLASSRWGLDERCPPVPGSNCLGWDEARFGGSRNDAKAPAPTGAFVSLPSSAQHIPSPLLPR